MLGKINKGLHKKLEAIGVKIGETKVPYSTTEFIAESPAKE